MSQDQQTTSLCSICVNCKRYWIHRPEACKCGGKTFERTHYANAVKAEDNPIATDLKQALQEVEMIKSGQMKSKSVDEMLRREELEGKIWMLLQQSISAYGGELSGFDSAQEAIADLIEQREGEVREGIKKAIKEVEEQHPYKIVGNYDTWSQYNEGWTDACDILDSTIDTLFTQKTQADGEQ